MNNLSLAHFIYPLGCFPIVTRVLLANGFQSAHYFRSRESHILSPA